METAAKEAYPGLYNLVRTYLDQDYDVYGETVDEIVSAFREDNDPAFVQQTVEDIERFLTNYPEDEAELRASFRRVFEPEISFYCWEGRTIRRTLLHIVEVLTR